MYDIDRAPDPARKSGSPAFWPCHYKYNPRRLLNPLYFSRSFDPLGALNGFRRAFGPPLKAEINVDLPHLAIYKTPFKNGRDKKEGN